MAVFKIFVCFASLIALYSQAETIKMDKEETINGVALQTGKVDSVRTYQGHITKHMKFSLENVLKGVVNFSEKCNNNFKSKRKYIDQKIDCKYHNDNIIESFVVRDLIPGWKKQPGEIDRYIIGRQVYNRGSFSYYESIIVLAGANSKGQKTITVIQKMLENDEVKQYLTPKFEKESPFDRSMGVFTLTQLGLGETTLSYDYKSETEHWILNKEVSIPQVFASISKSINDLVKTVDSESSLTSREIASQNQ